MKKILTTIFVILTVQVLFSYDYYLQNDDGTFNFYWYGNVRRASKYYVSDTCTLKMVYWGRYTKRTEIDTILIFNDNSGLPGNVIYSDTHSVNTNSTPMIVSDTVSTQVLVYGTFYVGMYARCQDQPANALCYFLSDSTPSFKTFWDSTGTWVVQTRGDYIIRAKVSGPYGISLRLYEENVPGEKGSNNNFGFLINEHSVVLNNIKSFSIIDKNGRKILDGISKNVVLDLTKFKSGIYFLIIKDLNNQTHKKKLIKF
ncbi:MAG: hypothetical protein ABIN00_04010 [candidate division WOR-3 bacterium]